MLVDGFVAEAVPWPDDAPVDDDEEDVDEDDVPEVDVAVFTARFDVLLFVAGSVELSPHGLNSSSYFSNASVCLFYPK